jgi:hypothetical protein
MIQFLSWLRPPNELDMHVYKRSIIPLKHHFRDLAEVPIKPDSLQ